MSGRGAVRGAFSLAVATFIVGASARAEEGPPATPAGILKGRALIVRPALRKLVGTTRAIGTESFNIVLPAGARQGGGRWYLMRLKGGFTVRRAGATSQISVSVNGRAALQLLVSLGSRRLGAPAVPVIDELDLLQGETVLPVRQRQAAVDESNYVQLEGLRGGENTITVKEEGFGAKPLVSAVSVLPGSGLYETALGPSALSIHLPQTVRIRRDSAVWFPVTLIDTGDDARHTRVSISSSSPLVRISGPSGVEVGTVQAHRPRRIGFTLQGVQTGAATLMVSASSTASQPEASTQVVVYRYARSAAVVVLVSALMFLPSAALLVLSRRSSRRAHTSDSGPASG
jgi:hypothetical protein